MKLVGIKSKPTLYKFLAVMGRRNCKECDGIFWDTKQEMETAFCEKSKKEEVINTLQKADFVKSSAFLNNVLWSSNLISLFFRQAHCREF